MLCYCATKDCSEGQATPNACARRETRRSSLSTFATHVVCSTVARCDHALTTTAGTSVIDDELVVPQHRFTLPLTRHARCSAAAIARLPENVLVNFFLYCDADSLLQLYATCGKFYKLFFSLLLNGAAAAAPTMCKYASECNAAGKYAMSSLLAVLAEWHNTGVMSSRIGAATLDEWYAILCAARRERELQRRALVQDALYERRRDATSALSDLAAHSSVRASDGAACLGVVREWLRDLQHRRVVAQNVHAGRFYFTRFEQSVVIRVAPLLLANGLLCVLTRPRRVTLFARDPVYVTRCRPHWSSLIPGCRTSRADSRDGRDEGGAAGRRWRPVAEIETVFAVTGVFDDATRNVLLVASMYTPVMFYTLHTLAEQRAARRLRRGDSGIVQAALASPRPLPTDPLHADRLGGETTSVRRVETVCYSDFARKFLRVRLAVFSALEEWTWSKTAVMMILQGEFAPQADDAVAAAAVKATVLWRNTDITQCLGLPCNMTAACNAEQLVHQLDMLQSVASELSCSDTTHKSDGVALDAELTEYDVVAVQYVSEQTPPLQRLPDQCNDAIQTVIVAPPAAPSGSDACSQVTRETHYVLGVYNEQSTLMLAASMEGQVVLFVTSRHAMKELCSVTVEEVRELVIVHHPCFAARPAESEWPTEGAVRHTAYLKHGSVCDGATREARCGAVTQPPSSVAVDELDEEGQAMIAIGTRTATLLYAAQLQREVRRRDKTANAVAVGGTARLAGQRYVVKGYCYTSREPYMTPLYRFDHTGPCVFAPVWTPARALPWRGATVADVSCGSQRVSPGGRAAQAISPPPSSRRGGDVGGAGGGSGHPFFRAPFVIFVAARRLCLGFWRTYSPQEQLSLKPQAMRMWYTFELASLGVDDVHSIDAAAVEDDASTSYDHGMRAMLSDVTAIGVSPVHAFLVLGTCDGRLILLAPNLTVAPRGGDDVASNVDHVDDCRRITVTCTDGHAASSGDDGWRCACSCRACCGPTPSSHRVCAVSEMQPRREASGDRPLTLSARSSSARAVRAALLRRPFRVDEVFGAAVTNDRWLRNFEQRWPCVAPASFAAARGNDGDEESCSCCCGRGATGLVRVPLFLCRLVAPPRGDGDTAAMRGADGERAVLPSATACAVTGITIDAWRLTTMCAAQTIHVYDLRASLLEGRATRTTRTATGTSHANLPCVRTGPSSANALLGCNAALVTIFTISPYSHPCRGVPAGRGPGSLGNYLRRFFSSAAAGDEEGGYGGVSQDKLCWRDGVLLLHNLPFPWMCSVLDFSSLSPVQATPTPGAQADCVLLRAIAVRAAGGRVVQGCASAFARVVAVLSRCKRAATLLQARRRVSCGRLVSRPRIERNDELCVHLLPCRHNKLCVQLSQKTAQVDARAASTHEGRQEEMMRHSCTVMCSDAVLGEAAYTTCAACELGLPPLSGVKDDARSPCARHTERTGCVECTAPHVRLVSWATWVNLGLRAIAPLAVFPVVACALCAAHNVDKHATVVPRWVMFLLWTPVPVARGLYVVTRFQRTQASYGAILCLQDVIVVLLGLVAGPLLLILRAPFARPTLQRTYGQVAICVSAALVLCVATHAQRRHLVRRGCDLVRDVVLGTHFVVAALLICTIAIFTLHLHAPAVYTRNRATVLVAFAPMFALYYATTMYCARYCFVACGSIIVPVAEMMLFLLTVYPMLQLFYTMCLYWKWATQKGPDDRPLLLPSVAALSIIACVMCLVLLRRSCHLLLPWTRRD